jgi:hypothetical protein
MEEEQTKNSMEEINTRRGLEINLAGDSAAYWCSFLISMV